MYTCDKSDNTYALGIDNTPTHKYTIELSERDVDALQRLRERNGASMTATIPVERIAVWKTINQVCESENAK